MRLPSWLRRFISKPEPDPTLQRALRESQYTAERSLGSAIIRQNATARGHSRLERLEQDEIEEARRRLRGIG